MYDFLFDSFLGLLILTGIIVATGAGLIFTINWSSKRRPAPRIQVTAAATTASPAGTPAGGGPGWSGLGNHLTPMRAISLIVALVGIGIVAYLSGGDEPIRNLALREFGGIPLAFIVLGLLLIVFLYWRYADIRRKFVVLSVATIVFFVVWYLWKSGLIEHGQIRTVMYFIAIATSLAVADTFKGDDKKYITYIFPLVVFGMLGFSHIYTWPEFASLFRSGPDLMASVRPSTNRAVTPVGPAYQNRCPSESRIYTVGHQLVRVNPDGYCSTSIDVHSGGCVYMRAAGSRMEEGPFGHCRESLGLRGVNDVEYIRSAENRELIVGVRLEPRGTR